MKKPKNDKMKSAAAPKAKLSREEQRQYAKIQAEYSAVNKKECELDQRILKRRCRFNCGDMIQFASGEKAIVLGSEVVSGWMDHSLRYIRLRFKPVRGKRVLRTSRFVKLTDGIKLIEASSARTMAMLRGEKV